MIIYSFNMINKIVSFIIPTCITVFFLVFFIILFIMLIKNKKHKKVVKSLEIGVIAIFVALFMFINIDNGIYVVRSYNHIVKPYISGQYSIVSGNVKDLDIGSITSFVVDGQKFTTGTITAYDFGMTTDLEISNGDDLTIEYIYDDDSGENKIFKIIKNN